MALWEAEDYGVIADKACWTMFAVTTVVVALRIYCRLGIGSKAIGLDDYITLGCLVVMLVTCALVTTGSRYGLGRHMADIIAEEPQNLEMALKYNVVISAVLIWSFSLPKFAIIAILKRILNYGTKTTILFWGLALSSQACILATSVWWFEQCHPVERGWNLSIPGTCSPVSVLADLGYFTSAYSAFLDAFFALYPIPFIMRLNMPLKTRVAVSVALSLSIFACIISIYKLAIFGSVFAILATDATYPVPFLDILGVAEGCVLIVTASLPALGPLLHMLRERMSTAYGSHTRSASRNQLGPSGAKKAQQTSKLWGQNKPWGSTKGHKLSDPEASVNTRNSFDGIPLVAPPQTGKASPAWPHDIYKTTDITVSSESMKSDMRGHGNDGLPHAS